MLAILKYKAGNQTSVRRALDSLGIPCVITDDPETIDTCHGIIFPGVGAAGQAMDDLTSGGLDEVLKAQIWSEKPLLGICVGCQILLDYSEENNTKALGMVPGECRSSTPPGQTTRDAHPRAPHGLEPAWKLKGMRLFKGIPRTPEFYFVHSYYPNPSPGYVIGTTTTAATFCSVHGRPGSGRCSSTRKRAAGPA